MVTVLLFCPNLHFIILVKHSQHTRELTFSLRTGNVEPEHMLLRLMPQVILSTCRHQCSLFPFNFSILNKCDYCQSILGSYSETSGFTTERGMKAQAGENTAV